MNRTKTFKPYGDLILVQRVPKETITKSGLILAYDGATAMDVKKTSSGQLFEDYANVIKVGKKCLEVKEGDKIILGQHVGQVYIIDNVQYEGVREEHVLAIIERV